MNRKNQKIKLIILAIIIVISFSLLVAINVKSEMGNRKTVPLFGEIDTWIIYRESISNSVYTCLYGGLDGNNITLLLQCQTNEGAPQVPIKYLYNVGMDIVLPRIVLGDIIVNENGITYSETPNPNIDSSVRDIESVPGFELLIFIGAIIFAGIIFRINRCNVRKK